MKKFIKIIAILAKFLADRAVIKYKAKANFPKLARLKW
jgi:hypothetical protein